jgi:hypothetical protein
MKKYILSWKPMSEVDTFYSSWFHQVQVLNGESEVNLYLDYVAKLEGYPSVEEKSRISL